MHAGEEISQFPEAEESVTWTSRHNVMRLGKGARHLRQFTEIMQ